MGDMGSVFEKSSEGWKRCGPTGPATGFSSMWKWKPARLVDSGVLASSGLDAVVTLSSSCGGLATIEIVLAVGRNIPILHSSEMSRLKRSHLRMNRSRTRCQCQRFLLPPTVGEGD